LIAAFIPILIYGLNNLSHPESLAHQDYLYRVEFKTPPRAWKA